MNVGTQLKKPVNILEFLYSETGIMGEYFAHDYHGAPFQFFGIPQIIMLTLLVLLNIFLLRDRKKGESARKRTRWTIAVII